MSNIPGRLHVVATPIGNLGDISQRAMDTLTQADLVAAEDTRHSARLLTALGIRRPLISLHEHNEEARVALLKARLAAGQDVALISDAGTPLISDPGYRLVRSLRLAGFEVLTIPGPSSLIAALSVSGLPTDRFFFEGFLPVRAAARRRRLAELAECDHTLVMFEVGRRLHGTLEDMIAVFGGARPAAISRELTKRHETTRLEDLQGLAVWLHQDPNHQRGEFVVMVGPAPSRPARPSIPDAEELLSLLRAEGLSARAAARLAARLTGESANSLYARLHRGKEHK
ncbi:16S rRNA (cytidine(1402)-2'-O)-methyltransferase [Spiribacter sp. 2438]|uniref:16S rRNA (cytidine(1402)-2'-O)-methyltransferase n=1 Tax=Spiribacter sp. 2438 TaxID=2666185 RepID=UPI00351BCA82